MEADKVLKEQYRSLAWFKRNCINANEIINNFDITDVNYLQKMDELCDYPFPKNTDFYLMRMPHNYAAIDKNIAPIIRKLNDKGYETTFCCEGHGSEGYILFTNDLSKASRESLMSWVMEVMRRCTAWMLVEYDRQFCIRFEASSGKVYHKMFECMDNALEMLKDAER